ncbi:MAG: DUF368 domain-containing protein [Bacilli bacterium]
MRENISLIIKGLIIGVGKIIPGVSGGVLAISLGVYEKSLDAINNYFKDIKKNSKFLGLIVIGMIISIVLMSKVINFSLNFFYLPTMLLFVGMIAGGLPMLVSKIKGQINFLRIFLLIVSFTLLCLLFNYDGNDLGFDKNNFIVLFIFGFIDAFTMVVPGISGTAVLMIFDVYDLIIGTLSKLTDFSIILTNIKIIGPFFLGVSGGVIVFVRLISFCFYRFNSTMYFIIIGLAIASTLALVFKSFEQPYTLFSMLIGLFLFTIGYLVTSKLEKL